MEKFSVRIANSNDKKELLNLLDEVFNKQQRSKGKPRGDEFWNWKYKQNVFGKAVIHVIETKDEIVAAGTMWPWQFKSGVNTLSAFQLCDTVVSEKARGLGLFSKINKARIEYGVSSNADFLFNFPNKNSLPGYLNMGWYFLDKLTWSVKVLKPFSLINSLKDKSQSLKLNVPQGMKINNFDFSTYKDTIYQKNISVVKNSNFYEWRYKHHSSRDYGIIDITQGKKKSFAIYTLSGKSNVTEMIITDMYCKRGMEKIVIEEILRTAKKLNIAIIYMLQNGQFNKSNLLQKGFLPVKNKNLVCLPINLALENKLLNITNWDLFAGLHDSI